MKPDTRHLPYPDDAWADLARCLPPPESGKLRRRPRLDNDEAVFRRFLLVVWEHQAIPYRPAKSGTPGKHLSNTVTRTLLAARVSEWAACWALHKMWRSYLAQLPTSDLQEWLNRYAANFEPAASGWKNNYWVVDLARLLVIHAKSKHLPIPPDFPAYTRRWPV